MSAAEQDGVPRWQRTGRALLLVMLVLPPLLAGLGRSDCVFHMEVRALQSAQETWLRMVDEPRAWLVPSWNGEPRVNKPPLAVWIDVLAWTGVDPAHSTVDQLVHRARVAAALLAMALVLGLFITVTRCSDAAVGATSAIMLGTSLLFLRQARLASYDTYFMALAGLAVCAGVWAIAPRDRPAPRFPLCAWLACGALLGGAVLAKGPLAYLVAAAPLILLAAWSRPRAPRLVGCGLALLVSAAVAAPWYGYVLQHVPDAWARMRTEFAAERSDAQPIWYYLGLVGLVFPWCLWLPAAVAKAMTPQGRPALWTHRAAWVWFGWIFVALSLPAAKQQRYLTVILPAAAWLMALAWVRVSHAGWRRAQTGLMWLAGTALGVFGLLQPLLVQRGVLAQPELVGPPGWVWAVLAAAMALVTSAFARAHAMDRMERAAWLAGLWMTLAATPALSAYARSHHGRYDQRLDAEQVAALASGRPLWHLADPQTPAHLQRPHPKFLLYARRTIPPLSRADARSPATHGWLMAARRPDLDASLRAAGWSPVRDFADGSLPRTLYTR